MDSKTIEQSQLVYTKHARKRMKQRSLHPSEAELIYWYGTEVTTGEYFFRVKDANKLKAVVSRKQSGICTTPIDRLIGWKLVVDFPNVITCHKCTKASQKKRIKHLLH